MISRRQIIESQQEAGTQSTKLIGGNKMRRALAANLNESRTNININNKQRESRSSSRADLKSQSSRQTSNYKRHERLATASRAKSFQDYQMIGQELFANEEELDDSELEPKLAGTGGFSSAGRSDLAGQPEIHRHFDPYSIYGEEDEEEDVWYSEERLFEDHIQEIVDKWTSIDDEIWAKIICMERNRRIAKAYARKHSLTVNGSEDEYLDGTTLGLNSFDNPDRDSKTRHIKQFIGQGIRIKITHDGDILVKRMCKTNIFLHRPKQNPSDKQLLGSSTGNIRTSQVNQSNSSSDLYALNSDFGADLYGTNSFSNYHLLAARQNKQPVTGKPMGKFMITSDASTSSSSGNGKSIGTSSGKTGQHAFNGSSVNLLKGAGSATTPAAKLEPPGEYTSIALDFSKPIKIFDMCRFKGNLEREARSACPNRKRLQNECISIISFVVDDNKILNLPSWIMVINIVALDLLKTELGLMDPQDMFLFDYPVSGRQSQDENDLIGYQRYRKNQHCRGTSRPSSASRATNNDESIVSSTHPMMMMMQRREAPASYSNVFVSASKKAFANAAASGAYNREPRGRARKLVGHKAVESHRKLASTSSRSELAAESDNELQAKRNKLITSAGGKLLKQVAGTNAKHQSSSNSSSGFNSNCSNSQNDSSPASSNSNIAADLPDEPSGKLNELASGDNCDVSLDSSVEHQELANVKRIANINATNNNNDSSLFEGRPISHPEAINNQIKRISRGSRPPKLPHRMSSDLDDRQPAQQAPASESIPIPGPPTSQGKANLILVSPTGLSPTLPKRNQRKLATGAISGDVETPTEFQTIKHIDETGKCSVLLDNANLNTNGPLRRPIGIPAHAQLAPPATQRHIIKYLMSATRNKFAAVNMDMEQLQHQHQHQASRRHHLQHSSPNVPVAGRYRRPLPILPGELSRCGPSQRLDNHEENLYYCGLQARATNRQLGHMQDFNRPPLPPKQPLASSSSAIEAILADYRQSQYNQLLMGSHHPKYPAKLRPLQQQPSHSVTKPLMKFFRSSPSKQAPIFSSVDNLNNIKQERSASILKLLKRSTGRKAKESGVS